MEDLESIIAIVMALAIPIVAIIFGCWIAINKMNKEKEIRQLIIENDIDIERAKLLIDDPQKRKKEQYASLRTGLMLIGIGLGVLANYLLGLNLNDGYYPWMIIAVGIGIGLLASFFLERKLMMKDQSSKPADR